MKTSEPRRLTAAEMGELTQLAFTLANHGLTDDQQLRHDYLRDIERSVLRG